MSRCFDSLFFICLIVCGCSAGRTINRCCQDGEVLYKESSSYGCKINEEEFNAYLVQDPKYANVTYGFPRSCSNDSLIEVELTFSNRIPQEYCIDKLIDEQKPVLLTCKNQYTSEVLAMRTVSKCCGEGAVYDLKGFGCSYYNDTALIGVFRNFSGGETALLNVNYGLTCKSQIVYHYSNSEYEFDLTEDVLTLIKPNKEIVLKPGSFCLDESLQGALVARGCSSSCDKGPCLNKCCPDGHTYRYSANGTRPECLPTIISYPISFHDISNYSSPVPVHTPGTVGYRYGMSCNKYPLNPNDRDDDSYFDVVTGKMLVPFMPSPLLDDYCVEMVEKKSRIKPDKLYRFVCFPKEEDDMREQKLHYFGIGLYISCAFLAMTLLVYALLPQLRNLHGKTLMCHVTSMLIAYSCLARPQLGNVTSHLLCKSLGYVMYFFFIAAFSWLNVMCFDIWWTFGNIRAVHGMNKGKNIKKFLKYSSYAWGLPVVLTTTTYILDVYDVAPDWLDSNIGKVACFFQLSGEGNKAPWIILFITPIGIQIAVNVVFFILTAIHCNKVKSEIHRMQMSSLGERCKRRFMADRAKYVMNLKLFIVMGVLWVLEILSSFFSHPRVVWYALDLLNVLQGIPIFCILVLKKKVWFLIKKRLGFATKDQRGTSDVTMSTGLSSATSDHSGKKSINMNSLPLRKDGSNGNLLSK